MTEQEWLAGEDPVAMLGRLTAAGADGRRAVSDRKLRLLACACCRAGRQARDEWMLREVEAVERFADGEATEAEMLARHAGMTVRGDTGGMSTFVWALARPGCDLALLFEWAFGDERPSYPERRVVAALIRDVAGNPFRPVRMPLRWAGAGEAPVSASAPKPSRFWRPEWAAYGGPWEKALELAREAYFCRAGDGSLEFERLLVLSDALEDAGCDSECLLMYLRGQVWHEPDPDYRPGQLAVRKLTSPGPFVRGCWALDLLLGKE